MSLSGVGESDGVRLRLDGDLRWIPWMEIAYVYPEHVEAGVNIPLARRRHQAASGASRS